MSLLTNGRQWVGRGASADGRGASADGRGASAGRRGTSAGRRGMPMGEAAAGGRGTVKATTAVARNAVRAVDAPLPGGSGVGLAQQRAFDLTALLALAAARPGLWLVAGGALSVLAAAAAIALATGRLGPLARLDLAVVASTGLAVAAARVRRQLRLS